MWNIRSRRVAFWLGCVAIGCALLPVLSRAEPRGRTAISVESAAMLGIARPKKVELTSLSVRGPAFSQALAQGADGDTFDAAGLVEDANFAFFFDSLPDNHIFGSGEESAGLNLYSFVDTRIIGRDLGPGVPGTNLLLVNYFTDGSDLVPAGSLSPDENVLTALRFDVGTTAAGTDKISLTPNPGFAVVDSGICFFGDGANLGCFELVLDDSGPDGVAGVGIFVAGDIAGSGIDEMVMFWEIQVDPSCGDGSLDAGEECDDGNLDDGDGCSSTCIVEDVLVCDPNGDGFLDLEELAIIINEMTGPPIP